MSIQRIALRDIEANPYRQIDRYRISEEKIAALIQSYDMSGFWDGSLQARPHPTRAGKVEIAFGHHRIEAAKRRNLHEVGLVVAKRSDADMLRMMAFENREEFKGDQLVATETIGATIAAFGRGEIEFEPVAKDTNKAHVYKAPPNGGAYTCATVARFLGWTKQHKGQEPEPTNGCRIAFAAYHANVIPALLKLPEDNRTREATTAVLSAVKSARTVARRAGRSTAEADAAAARAARETVTRIKQGAIASKVHDEAAKIGRAAAGVERTPPAIAQFVQQRADGLRSRIVNLETEIDGVLNDVLPYRDQVPDAVLKHLLDALTFADTRTRALFLKWINRLTARSERDITPRRRLLKGGHPHAANL